MQAAWGLSLADPKADYAKVQEAWLKQLEEFVDRAQAKASTSPKRCYQLAMASEFPPGDAAKRAEVVRAPGDRIPQQPQRRRRPAAPFAG